MSVTLLRRLDPWGPPLVLMAVIFFFSAQPNLNSGLGLPDTIGRKLVHFAEYALLAFLWARALRTRLDPRRAALLALLIASLYAATDEFHQTFVEGRTGHPIDWAIDTAGAATHHAAAPAKGGGVTGRLPIESNQPVLAFAVVRVGLTLIAFFAALVLNVPARGSMLAVLGAGAIPWTVLVLVIALVEPDTAMNPVVALGDFALLLLLQTVVPETYSAVRFAAIFLVAVHAHFQGEVRGLAVAGLGSAALVTETAIRGESPTSGGLLAFYETVFVLLCLSTGALIGRLRTTESASRLRARGLSRRTIQAETEARRRVAEAIHDGPVQELIGLDMILSAASQAADSGDEPRAAELIDQAREVATRNVSVLRDEIVDLGPYAFEELGYPAAIENCLPMWKRRYGFEVLATIEQLDLRPQTAGDLFRITQEAVINAGRHAGRQGRVDLATERRARARAAGDRQRQRLRQRRPPRRRSSPGTSAWRACASGRR